VSLDISVDLNEYTRDEVILAVLKPIYVSEFHMNNTSLPVDIKVH
jgi:hypothetical protein